MEVSWNSEKNRLLLKNRGVCFEMVMEKIIQGDFRGPEIHPSRENQFRIIVFFQGYPYVVPMVIDTVGNWFLKTIYPSRKEKRRSNENEQR
jgi:uncharacterized DUF497 family protein